MATRIREKSKKREQEKDTRPFAKGKYIGISPSKMALVMDLIRGRKALEAVAILENIPNVSSESILKVLNSAIANAENNKGMSKADLVVSEAYVCPEPTMKRISIRAKGSADRILKRSSHITIILDLTKQGV